MKSAAGQLTRHGMSDADRDFFLEHGYLHVRKVLDVGHLARLQAVFERIWALEQPPVNQHKLLRHQPFIELIEHPPILDLHRTIFGNQVQLLQLDLLRQGPHSTASEHAWHRDFSFPGERPLAVNTILYLDDMSEETGPTRIVPGTHRGTQWPETSQRGNPLPGEVAVFADAGDVVLVNSAVWHTGGRNRGPGLRRAVYLYYGWWWLKRYESHQDLPWQVFVDASEQRLHLLGVKMPDPRFHMYEEDVLSVKI